MTQPTAYNRLKSFTQYALDHPDAPYNAADHDAELNAIEQTLDEMLANLAKIQRDDGKIANASVHPDTLDAAVRALIAATWTPRGLWAASTSYAVGDVVEESGHSYVAAVEHVSGSSFSTDHASGKWVVLSLPAVAASGISFSATSTIPSANVQAAIEQVEENHRPVRNLYLAQHFWGL